MARKSRRKAAPAPPMTMDDAAALVVQASPDNADLMRAAATALTEAATTLDRTGGSGSPLLASAGAALAAAVESADTTRCEDALADASMILEALMAARDAAPAPAVSAVPVGSASPARAASGEESARGGDDAAHGGTAEAYAAAAAGSFIPADADPELLDGFVAESLEYLDAAESALLVLEARPDDAEGCNTVFRAFHTIKGTAAFLGLAEIADFAHWAESLLGRVRERRIRFAHAVADLSLRSVDMLRGHVQIVRAAATPGAPLALPNGYAQLMDTLRAADGDDAIDAPPPATAPAVAGSVATDSSPAVAPDASTTGSPRIASTPAGAGTAGESPDTARSGGDAWMRVRTERLDRLIDTVGELVIAHAMIAEDETLGAEQRYELARKVTHTGKIVRELQDLSMSMRMLPLRPTFQKVTRLVRDLAQRTGKPIELVTNGEDTEIDRSMVELIGDPLVHMVRNSIDHGIECADDRIAAGKPASGRLRLTAFHAGGTVVIELEDDGRGLDRERIMQRAVERGLVEAGKVLSDADIYQLIFAPGFSTAETVTAISGRGVGMDVVRRNVEALRGRIEITSKPGEGTKFSIRLPLTLAITDGMLVRVGAERYIVPTVNIHLSFRPESGQLSTIGGRGELVRLRDELLPLVRLHRLFGVDGANEDPTRALLVVVGSGQRRFAVLVDDLVAQQQVVAKPLGNGIGRVDGVSGSAILGDGRVGLILDIPQLHQLSLGATIDTADAA